MAVMPSLWENTKWRVGEGKISFWFDHFLVNGPLFREVSEVVEPDLMIQDLVVENYWDVQSGVARKPEGCRVC